MSDTNDTRGAIHDGDVPENMRRVPQSSVERAADGAIMQTTAHSVGHFLDFMEDGQFSQDVYDELKEVADAMTVVSGATGNKVKGKLTIEIDLEKDGDHFRLQGKFKSKKPEEPRPKSVVWQNERNDFTRFPPNQRQMFGTARPVRNV
jgi:hypothetical protein